ncbi:hypothetical protein EDF62_3328 [Leucobacter luti]|uniref:Uncharacterized protein n=1 Tax=Leucobacter luti TaxID=340320 RepID=A0A4R6RTH7_9MICO|nr:hypothetical protein [Leucobacter luti]TDP89575.1 hypothetical protein EDF62_3328 [Leucobacter luti]
MTRRIHRSAQELHDAFDLFTGELIGAGASFVQVGAVAHGLADHSHCSRVVELLRESNVPAQTLRSYFADIAHVLRGRDVDGGASWGAERIMASQSVSMGTVAQSALLGLGSHPTSASVVAGIFDSFTVEHCAFICEKVIRDHLLLEGGGSGEKYWPEVTSLGRYFHALGDDADGAAHEEAREEEQLPGRPKQSDS